MTVRTRFAPSPTGFLHVGSARTALYSWLYARHLGGKFILRIEDTDLERSSREAVDAILEAMEWLELEWDEGPYYQTQHFDRYRAVAEQLIKSNQAYYCHCSKDRLEKLREEQLAKKQKPRYDGHCRERNQAALPGTSVIRFRNPLDGEVVIEDSVHGQVTFSNSELDDLVLVRSEGTPTYNFTVVIDDWDMKITHVIRGDDHLNNTPKQINLLKALGAQLPVYSHIPMILGSDGKRLSKRHGAVSVQYYRDEGFLAHALLNYLVRLGWSHGDQEIFSRQEMIQHFDIHHLNKSASMFDREKLEWLNQHYLKTKDPKSLAAELERQFKRIDPNLVIRKSFSSRFDEVARGQLSETAIPELEAICIVQRERVKTLKEMAEKSLYFYQEKTAEPQLLADYLNQQTIDHLVVLRQSLSALSDLNWQETKIHEAIQKTASKLGVKLGDLAKPLRIIATGGTVSPPIDITLQLLGKNTVFARLDRVLEQFSGDNHLLSAVRKED
jgi:glutamyl-tRNA synthetase